MRPIVGAFDGVDTGRGREGAYPDRPLHPLAFPLPLSPSRFLNGRQREEMRYCSVKAILIWMMEKVDKIQQI